jgi:hypothetical protein
MPSNITHRNACIQEVRKAIPVTDRGGL